MDGKRNHSMGSPMDGTPHSPKTDSDHLMKAKFGPLLSVDLWNGKEKEDLTLF